jgi:YVTN family beta-propeller protein
MYKRSELMKILAVSIVLLFLVSGFSVMVYGSGPEKSISSGDKSGNISITNSRIAPVNNSSNITVIANISVGSGPEGIAYDPSNGYIYVANFWSHNVSVINGATNKVIASIAVGSYPAGVAYDPSNGYVYVTNYGSNSVSVINGATNTVITNITVGVWPVGVAYDSSNGYVYVTNYGLDYVSVINGATNTVITNITVGLGPIGVAYDPSNGYIYVAIDGLDYVSVINGATNTVIANISVGMWPQGVAYDSSNGYVYVTNEYSNSVSVINGATNTVITNITVGSDPIGVAYDPSNGYIYVANYYSNNVSVINGATNTVIASIAVGSNPWGVAYDPFNGYIYVTNYGSDTVSIISIIKKYSVTFTESGLPSGTSWSVTFNRTTESSTTDTITFSVTNGTYSYTIETPISGGTGTQYVVSQSTGTLTVNGADININVPYTTQYYLTMIASPSNGGTVSPSSGWYNAGSSVTIDAISNSNFEFVSWSGTGNSSYSGTNNPVSITINGPITETANFIELYQVMFVETGLPSGTTWYVNLSNGQSFSSTTNTITFNEPNGTYSYTIATVNKIYALSPSSGTFKVSGGNVNVVITFNLVTYTVTFTENGLPSGTIWYVNLSNGKSYSGTGTTITFSEPNGTYSYTIATVNKSYSPSQSSGTFKVNGANVNIGITFNLVTYKITFTENGLSSGTSWSVTLNNITKTSTNGTIIFNEPNGTYSYIISGISGYRANTYSGTINVNGNPISNSITWTVITYPITITENGIPNGTSWSATLTGTTFNGQYINITLSSTTNTITFNEPNGTYSYIIHLPSGYQSSNAKGSVNVSGNSAIATFKAQQTMNYLWIGIIAVVIIIAIVIGLILLRRGKNKQGVKEWKEPPKQN